MGVARLKPLGAADLVHQCVTYMHGDMCMDTFVDMGIDLCVNMCAGIITGMLIDMHTGSWQVGY